MDDSVGVLTDVLMDAFTLVSAEAHIQRIWRQFNPTEPTQYSLLNSDPPSPFSDEYDHGRGMPDDSHPQTAARLFVRGSDGELQFTGTLQGAIVDIETRPPGSQMGDQIGIDISYPVSEPVITAEQVSRGPTPRFVSWNAGDSVRLLPLVEGAPNLSNLHRRGEETAEERERESLNRFNTGGTESGRMSSHLPPYTQADARVSSGRVLDSVNPNVSWDTISGTEALMGRINALEGAVMRLQDQMTVYESIVGTLLKRVEPTQDLSIPRPRRLDLGDAEREG